MSALIPENNYENFEEQETKQETKQEIKQVRHRSVFIDFLKTSIEELQTNPLKMLYIIFNIVLNKTCDTLYGKTALHTLNNYVFWYLMFTPRLMLGLFGLLLQLAMYIGYLFALTGAFDNNDPGQPDIDKTFRYRGDMFGAWKCLSAIRTLPTN